MLLIDLSSVAVPSCISASYNQKLTLNLVREVINTQILFYSNKFKKYGKPIITIDSNKHGGYWRNDVFKYYKFSRKSARVKSDFNWKLYFKYLAIVIDELYEYSHYTMLKVDKCEADDIIAVLTLNYINKDIIIVSTDKDLLQLNLHNQRVKQYSIRHKGILDYEKYDLLMHIIKGDASDGVPNIFSPDNIFTLEGVRQTVSNKGRVNNFKTLLESGSLDDKSIININYNRNKLLIDLTMIPKKYSDEILHLYINSLDEIRYNRMAEYFIKFNLKYLYNRQSEML